MKMVVAGWMACAALLAPAVCAAGGADDAATERDRGPKTARELSQKTRELVAKFSRSLATVRYWGRKNAQGENPRVKSGYRCPNCGSEHYGDREASAERRIPGEFVGFVLAKDRILMQDLHFPAEYLDRIEITCAGERLTAVEAERCPGRGALVLRPERPFADAVPLVFAGGGEEAVARYFYDVEEAGQHMASVSDPRVTGFQRYDELGHEVFRPRVNELALNERDEPVTVALKCRDTYRADSFDGPDTWAFEPADAERARLAARLADLRRSVLPVFVQLEAAAKEEGRNRGFRIVYDGFGGNREDGNEFDASGIVLENGEVLVLKDLSSSATARLSRLEATLADGAKAELEFVGSLKRHGAFVARFRGGLPAGATPLRFDRRPAQELFGETFDGVFWDASAGSVWQPRALRFLVWYFGRTDGNEVVPEFNFENGDLNVRGYDSNRGYASVMLSRAGAVAGLELAERREGGRHRYFYGGSSDGGLLRGSRLLALVDGPEYDPENVPRSSDDRRRTAWLGVEVQAAGAEIVREKKAAAYLTCSFERAALVTAVHSNTPAAQLGLRVGDILLAVRHAGRDDASDLTVDRERSGIDWGEVFGDDRYSEMIGQNGMTPWPDAEGGVNGMLTAYGIGSEVAVSWVTDGQRREGTCTLALQPAHYRNAPRTRNRELGLTVADLTYEVRKYFKLDETAPGVVIAKVKSGGPAAVAGLKPLELVVQVNGEGVRDARDFLAKTKGRTELTFAVRRLSATRVVPIKVDDAAAGGDGADDSGMTP